MNRALAGTLVAALAATTLAGCSRSSAGSSGDEGFVSGDGGIAVVKAADRERAGSVEGPTLSGGHASLRDLRGKIVVINVWGSWCGPCRKEAPVLAKAQRQLESRGVEFLGINTRDAGTAAPRAFERRFDVPYDSIFDPGGRTLLAFDGSVPPNAIPTTLVIDRQGRVAAGVNGDLTSATTLVDVVEDVDRGTA